MRITSERMGLNVNKIHLGSGTYMLFSFETLVAFIHEGKMYRDEYNYSRTTNKHISQFGEYQQDAIKLSQEQLVNKVRAFMALDSIEDIDNALIN